MIATATTSSAVVDAEPLTSRRGSVLGREGGVAAAKRSAGLNAAAELARRDAPRLLLVDTQIDPAGTLAAAALPDVTVVKFDSATEPVALLASAVASAAARRPGGFASVAVANHGVGEDGKWRWGLDCAPDPTKTPAALDMLAPVLDTVVAVLTESAEFGATHIDLFSCRLADAAPSLVPALERRYQVDFRASTDDTGNAAVGGNWSMETDDDYDAAAAYFKPAELERFQSKLAGKGALIGRMIGYAVDAASGGMLGGHGAMIGGVLGAKFDKGRK